MELLKKYIFIPFTFLVISAGAQNQFTENAQLHLRGKYGFIIPHRSFMSHLLQGPTFAFELDYEKQTTGRKSWHKAYRYPFVGVTAFYYDYGNPDVLGQSMGILPYLNFHLVRKKTFGVNFRVGMGLSYTTEKFHSKNNYKNIAIGSHYNATIDFMLSVRKSWNRYTLTGGIEFMHHSNGATFLPNLGINAPTLNIGIGYQLSKEENTLSEPKIQKEISKKWNYQFLGIASVKQEYPIGTPHFGVAALGISGIRMFTLKSGLMLRLDAMYNNTHQRNITNHEKGNFSQIWQGGFSGNYYLSLERLKFLFGMGVYFKNTLNPDGFIYSRVGLQYQWPSGWVANLCIKSHYARADYAEFGIGYTILR